MTDTGPRVMNRWLVVLGAVLIQLCLGAIYAWSVFTPSLTRAGWSKLDTQIVFSVGLAVFAVVMVWAGRKLPEIGPRRMAWLGGVVLGAGYAAAGLFGASHFWVTTLFIGVVGGAGIGMGYVVPIAVGMRWFPDKKGLITGLAVAGFGFGAMLWVKLAGAWGGLIATLGLDGTFTVYGVAFMALVLLGGVWMVFPPAGWLPEGYVPPESTPGGAGLGTTDFSPGRMLETPQFYLIFLAFTISAGAGLMSIGLMKLYPIEALTAQGLSGAEASAVAGTAMAVFFSLANGIGRIAWGMLSDRIGRRRSILIMTTSQGFFVISFTFLAGSEPLLYLGAALIGFNFGGNFALFPTITADTFGTNRVGQNYPYVFLAYGVGGIAGPILGGMLGDVGNFPLAFTICGIACIVGAGCIARVSTPSLPQEATDLEPEDAEPIEAEPEGDFSWRPLREEDAALIATFPGTAQELFFMFPRASVPLTTKQIMDLAGFRKLPTVVLCGGEVAGYANVIACEDGTCEVGNVVVAPRFRRRGVGAYLLTTMERRASAELGAARLRAACFNENTAALFFYDRLGYHPAGLRQWRRDDGRALAQIFMEKPL